MLVPKSFGSSFILGSALWDDIHLGALSCENIVDKMHYHRWIHSIYDSIHCGGCKKHMLEYLQKYPVDSHFQPEMLNGVDVALYRWSWMFHNDVNKRLYRRQPPFEEALARHLQLREARARK